MVPFVCFCFFFFFQAEDGIRDWSVTGVQTCALPILYCSDCLSKQTEDVEHSIDFIKSDLGTKRLVFAMKFL